jgi:hypothetical protein
MLACHPKLENCLQSIEFCDQITALLKAACEVGGKLNNQVHKIRIENCSKNFSMISSIQSVITSWRMTTPKHSEPGCGTRPKHIIAYLHL